MAAVLSNQTFHGIHSHVGFEAATKNLSATRLLRISNSSLLMTVQSQNREVNLGPKIGTYLYIYNIISNVYL